MAFHPICPRCESEAVMTDKPGYIPGNTLRCECMRCHYSDLTLRFSSWNGRVEIENRLEAMSGTR